MKTFSDACYIISFVALIASIALMVVMMISYSYTLAMVNLSFIFLFFLTRMAGKITSDL